MGKTLLARHTAVVRSHHTIARLAQKYPIASYEGVAAEYRRHGENSKKIEACQGHAMPGCGCLALNLYYFTTRMTFSSRLPSNNV